MKIHRFLITTVLLLVLSAGMVYGEEDVPIFSSRDFSALNPVGLSVTLGTSAVSLGLFNLFAYLGNLNYAAYTETASARDAAVLQHSWMLYDTLAYVFLGTTVFSLAATVPLILSPSSFSASYERDGTEELDEKEIQRRSKRLERLTKRLDGSFKREETLETGSLAALGSGITLLTVTGLGAAFAESAYNQYEEANYSADAESLRTEVDVFQYTSISAGLTSAAAFSTAAVFSLAKPNPLHIRKEIDRIHTAFQLDPQAEVDSSLYNGPSYGEYCSEQIAELSYRRTILQSKLRKAQQMKTKYRTGFWVGLGVGAVSLVSTGISLYLTDQVFDEYNQGEYTDEAEELKKTYELAKVISYISGTAASVGLSTAAFSKIFEPSPVRTKRELKEIEQQLKLYRWRLQQEENLF
jgi:hypothetical protein